MPDALVFDVPVEFGLELVPIIGAHFANAEREFGDYGVDEVYGVGLGVAIIDLQGPDAGGIVDCRVLEALDDLAVNAFKFQEFYVDLYLMPRHALLVSLGMDFPNTRTAGKPTKPVPLQNSIDAGVRDGDGMVPAHIPGNAHRAEMISGAQMQDFLDDFCRLLVGGIFWCAGSVLKPGLAIALESRFPSIETGSANTEIAAGLRYVTVTLGMLKNAQLM